MSPWKQFLVFLGFAIGIGLLLSSRATQLAQAQTTNAAAPAAGGGRCSVIGNNTASPFGADSPSLMSEAQYTLALLNSDLSNVDAVISTINGTTSTVVVRIGAGEAPLTSGFAEKGQEYASALNRIALGVGGKAFVAMAGHNEPNCAEYIPLKGEAAFVSAVAGQVTASNVTLITGQIDIICGDYKQKGRPSPTEYIQTLGAINNIKGVSIPFYTGDPGNSGWMLGLFNAAVSASSQPIYITETGVIKPPGQKPDVGAFTDYISGLSQAVSNEKVTAAFLFNAFGSNSDARFTFTSPFWKAACREAIRTQCTDPATVAKICVEDLVEDKKGYYLYPIRSLLNNASGGGQGAALQVGDELIDQGYEVACTSPSLLYGGDLIGWKEFAKRMGLSEDAALEALPTKQWKAWQTNDYSKVQYPIFRADSMKDLEASLETYWGQRDIEATKDKVQQTISSAPTYRLLPLEAQCQAQKDVLKTMFERCQEIDNPAECALDQPIKITSQQTSSYSTLELYDEIKNRPCSELVTSGGSGPEQEIKASLKAVPLYLEKSYRLAFLVVTARVFSKPGRFAWEFMSSQDKHPTDEPKHEVRVLAFRIPEVGTNPPNYPTIPTQPFKDPLAITRDSITPLEVIAKRDQSYAQIRTALKQATQQAGTSAGSQLPIDCRGPYCEDPLSKALVNLVNGSLSADFQQALKNVRLPFPISDTQQPSESEISNLGDSLKNKSQTTQTSSQLGSTKLGAEASKPAEVDMFGRPVNNLTFTCGEQTAALSRYEEAKELTDRGSFTPPPVTQNPTLVFKVASNIIKKLFTAEGTTPAESQKTRIDFNNIFDPSFYKNKQPLVTLYSAYLVYPVGYDLKLVEDSLAGVIMTNEKRQEFSTNPEVKPFFQLSSIDQDFESEVESYEYQMGVDGVECTEQEAKDNGGYCTRYVWYKAVDLGFQPGQFDNSYNQQNDQNMRPRIHGGILGNLMRRIQLTLRTYATKQYTYIESCKTTEDFLLGKCGDPSVTNALSCAQKYQNDPAKLQTCLENEVDNELKPQGGATNASTCIDVWMDDNGERQAAADKLRQTLAIQQKPTTTFAGWGPYFVGKDPNLYVNQHLFGTCGGTTCYNYILDRVLSESSINPYLAIAIALNETGGLYSTKPGNVGPHFGCAPSSPDTIENKLSCMIKTLNGYRQDAKYNTDSAALERYGYVGGENNKNLNKIIGIISEGSYNGSCADTKR